MPGPADLLDLAPAPGGTRLKLRVKPGARKNALLGAHAGALKLAVTAAPEKGRANDAVLALLAARLAVPVSSLEIASGGASRDKVVVVPLVPEELRERLRDALTSVTGTSS